MTAGLAIDLEEAGIRQRGSLDADTGHLRPRPRASPESARELVAQRCRSPSRPLPAHEKMLPSSDATKASKNLRRSALARNSLGCWSLNAGFARSNHALTRSSASDSSSEDASGNRTTNPFGEDSTSSFEQIPWNFSASCKSLHVIVSSVDCWASPPLSSQSRRTNRLTISSSSRKHRPSLSSSGSSIGLAMVAVYHRSSPTSRMSARVLADGAEPQQGVPAERAFLVREPDDMLLSQAWGIPPSRLS